MKFKVEMIKTENIVPYNGNPRKNDKAVKSVAMSISEYGWRVPIVVDEDNVIIAGHTRLMAAKKLGIKEIPAHIAIGLTDAQKTAYRIADNRTTEYADWDYKALAVELESLAEDDYDLELTGLLDREIEKILGPTSGLIDDDEIPEAGQDVVAKIGDIWILGDHRVACGDSTDPDIVGRLLGDSKPNLMVTDPPYGVEYDPGWRAAAGVNKNKKKMGEVLNDSRPDWREAWTLFPGKVLYIWHASTRHVSVFQSVEACGFDIRSIIVWAKDRFALGRGDYHWQHEPCLYAVKRGGKSNYHGGRSQSTVWNIPARDDSGHGHGTQKPVECMRRPMENNSDRGDIVYDPFLGSGTSIIAAETSGRVCYGCELSPKYVDLTIRRWEEHTGKTAELDE